MSTQTENKNDFTSLNACVKKDIFNGNFTGARIKIEKAMAEYPHDPVPHNLMGILLENQFEHNLAMRHFRAALDLDPGFRPARSNMEKYGRYSGERFRQDAYEDGDCVQQDEPGTLITPARGGFRFRQMK